MVTLGPGSRKVRSARIEIGDLVVIGDAVLKVEQSHKDQDGNIKIIFSNGRHWIGHPNKMLKVMRLTDTERIMSELSGHTVIL